MTQNLAISDIVSIAFMAMEKTPPASFEDASEEATAATKFYPGALHRCLEQGDWSFASTLAELPEVTPGPTVVVDPKMPYLYLLPGECLRVREVEDGDTRWRIDRHGLRSALPPRLRIRYTARIMTENLLPASFRQAVGLHLAVMMGPRWLGTANKMEALRRDAEEAMAKAQREDARTASDARYDGLPDQGDWVFEATR